MLRRSLPFLIAATLAAQVQAPAPEIQAQLGKEDGRPNVIVTVTQDQKPVANVGVTMLLHRSFGELTLGQDTTLDDGTAVAPFPPQLSPDPDGSWTVKVQLTSPDAMAGQEKEIRLAAPPASETRGNQANLPRALWGRHAPISLILAVLALVGSAWAAYGYTLYQLFHLKKGGHDAPQP